MKTRSAEQPIIRKRERVPVKLGTVDVFIDEQGKYVGKTIPRGIVCFPCHDRTCCPDFIPETGRGNYNVGTTINPRTGKKVGTFHSLTTRRKNYINFEPPVPGKFCIYPIGALDQVGGSFLVVNFPYAILVDAGAIVQTEDYDEDFERLTSEVVKYIPGLKDIITQYGLKLRAIVPTHGHMDHIGAIPFLGKLYPYEDCPRIVDEVPIICSTITYQYILKIFESEARRLEKERSNHNETYDPFEFAPPKFNPFNLELDLNTRNKYSQYIVDMEDGQQKPETTKAFEIYSEENELVFRISFVPENHSIPGSYGVLIEGCGEKWFYTGDAKINGNDTASGERALKRYQELGTLGLTGVITDALHIDRDTLTPPEDTLIPSFREILTQYASRDTIYVFCFGSLRDRILTFKRLAAEFQRTIIIEGRSQRDSDHIANYFVPEEKGIPAASRPKGSLVLCTGAQFEKYSVGWRLAHEGKAGKLRAKPGDLAVISSRPIPGTELAWLNGVRNLLGRGVDVVIDDEAAKELDISNWRGTGNLFHAPAHLTGHEGRKGIKLMLEATRPVKASPTHCRTQDIAKFEQLLNELGIELSIPQLGQYLK